MATLCRWCGDHHDVTALCQRAQRGMTRRSFLFLTTTAAAALALPTPDWPFAEYPPVVAAGVNPNIGQIVAEEWNRIIGAQLVDNIFNERSFKWQLAEGMKKRLL